jgi:predicted RNA-binding Zn-ribbon protein involved in translation (DUF1610 family)
MTPLPTESFECPHCGATTSWSKPGVGKVIGIDLLATVITLPFLAFGVFGFFVAVCVAGVALIFIAYRSARCSGCGKQISRAQARSRNRA